MSNDHLTLLLAAGEPTAFEWITAAARVVVAQGGNISLERAAGLAASSNGRKRGLRDAYLRRAAVALGGGVAVGPGELRAAIQRFAPRWQQWQARRLPPEYANEVEVGLFHAHRLGPIPTTVQGLGCILRESRFW